MSAMTEPPAMPEPSKTAKTLLVLFIPSVDRHEKTIDQNAWTREALIVLAKCFGGATAFPKGIGVWRDDKQGGRIIEDEPVIIHCYTTQEALDQHFAALRTFLVRMGQETNQAAVGYAIGDAYQEIPL
jgi:hypothetical protein